MRLPIAVAILVNTLPALSKTEDFNHDLENDIRKQRLLSIVHEELPSYRIAAGNRFNRHKKIRRTLSNNRAGILTNTVPVKAEECEPKSNNADVGVLSCGVGKYCMATETSVRGGICVDEDHMNMDRLLQNPSSTSSTSNATFSQVCGALSANFSNYCDCKSFDTATETGKIGCAFEGSACLGYFGCNDTCFDTTYTYAKYEGSSPIYGYCHDWTSPKYHDTLCFGYSNTESNCTFSLDGTLCNSCYLIPEAQLTCLNEDCVYKRCVKFDCQNVGLGSGDSCQQYLYTPSLKACIANITQPPAAAPTATDSTSSYGQHQPLFQCNICGAGKVVTNPEGIVPVPHQYDMSCFELDTAAQAGKISGLDCRFVQQVTSACGCQDANGGLSAPSNMGANTSNTGAITSNTGATNPQNSNQFSSAVPPDATATGSSSGPKFTTKKIVWIVGLSLTALLIFVS